MDAVSAAVVTATTEIARLKPIWEAAHAAKHAAESAIVAIEWQKVYADVCAEFAAKNAGNLVQREDGKYFGVLSGNGELRRSLRCKVLTGAGIKTEDTTVYAAGPGKWADRPANTWSGNRGNIWHEVTE
jgi:hypothetical protein